MPHPPYGAAALLGCATPQGNPTVEPELHRLLPDDVNLLVTRSTAGGEPRERLLAYFDRLGDALDSFGGLALDAFGFACTASSYLLTPGTEPERLAALTARYGYPVRSAAGAVERVLKRLGVRRLLIGSPYPDWVHEACLAHWKRRGFEIVRDASARPHMRDTRDIYALDPGAVGTHLERTLAGARADAVLVTGTGLPTLPLRQRLGRELGLPVVSANPALAWDLLAAAHPAGAKSAPAAALFDRLWPGSG